MKPASKYSPHNIHLLHTVLITALEAFLPTSHALMIDIYIDKIFQGARPELITDLAKNGVGGRFWSKTFPKPLMLTPGARVARKNASK